MASTNVHYVRAHLPDNELAKQPLNGATLSAILTLGLSQQTVGQAMWLASGYSVGLAIPFLFLNQKFDLPAAHRGS